MNTSDLIRNLCKKKGIKMSELTSRLGQSPQNFSKKIKRAWFYTPYLMLGDTLRDAFIRAAERGVDVRLIVPGIPDKKIVYKMTQANYSLLLNAGVRIFEYTPGFVHAKATIFDDKIWRQISLKPRRNVLNVQKKTGNEVQFEFF